MDVTLQQNGLLKVMDQILFIIGFQASLSSMTNKHNFPIIPILNQH